MISNKYRFDAYLSKCKSKKVVKSIMKILSTFKKIVDVLFVTLFFILGNVLVNAGAPVLNNAMPTISNLLPNLSKTNLFAESDIFRLLSQEAVFYVLFSHVIVKFTLKLCFLFICAKAFIALVKFVTLFSVEKENEVNKDNATVNTVDGVVCYKSKVQFLN